MSLRTCLPRGGVSAKKTPKYVRPSGETAAITAMPMAIHSFDLLPLKEGRTLTGMHVWHGRGAGLTSMAWDYGLRTLMALGPHTLVCGGVCHRLPVVITNPLGTDSVPEAVKAPTDTHTRNAT